MSKEKAHRELCGQCGRFFRAGWNTCDRQGCPFDDSDSADPEPEAVTEPEPEAELEDEINEALPGDDDAEGEGG